jgi:hypothetical protein
MLSSLPDDERALVEDMMRRHAGLTAPKHSELCAKLGCEGWRPHRALWDGMRPLDRKYWERMLKCQITDREFGAASHWHRIGLRILA